jgi:hypothetical protein
MTYNSVTKPTTIYGSTLDLVFTGGYLPSITKIKLKSISQIIVKEKW